MYAYKHPIYTRGRIMTREILETMRDVSFDIPYVHYMNHTDGMIIPCSIKVTENTLIIGKGLMKWQDKLYIMTEPVTVDYYPTEEWRVLKIKFLPQTESKDFTLFDTEIFLDENIRIGEDEMEIGRFKLKAGSRLRQNYVDFHDLNTEFDTLNVILTPFAGIGSSTISPHITRHFAREAYPHTISMPFDNGFICTCMSSERPISRELITGYVKARLALKKNYFSGDELYAHLSQILQDIKNGIAVDGYDRRTRGRKIFVE